MTVPAVITAPRTQVVIDFLTATGWDTTPELGYPLFPGPEILVAPDRAVFITDSGGPGYTTEEGGTDAWSFQARVRGPSDDPLAAQAAAQLLDWTILTASCPAWTDGIRVISCFRLGGPPSVLPLDPGDRRFEYTADYVFVTGA
jgi:hypothetical protein